MPHFLVVVYRGTFLEFDVAHEFVDEAEARAFARSKIQASAVLLDGTWDDWFRGRAGKPLAIYCYGVEFTAQ